MKLRRTPSTPLAVAILSIVTLASGACSSGAGREHNRLATQADTGSYAAAVLADQPVAYWRLGESAGNQAVDSSGNGFSGSYVNGPTFGVPGAIVGDPDTAISMTGPPADAYVAIPDAPSLELTTDFSLEAWIFQTSSNGNGFRLIDKEIAGLATATGYDLDTYGAGLGAGGGNGHQLRICGGYIGGVANCVNADTPFSLNAWHHVAVTVTGGIATFYLDGRPDGSRSAGQFLQGDLDLRIGAPHLGCGGSCGLSSMRS